MPEVPPIPDTPFDVTNTVDGYRAAVEALSEGSGPIAVDAERASGFRYSQRAYLIQMYRRGSGVFLFDPPAIGDFSSLQQAISGEEWVLHAASQDLPCLREVGLNPARIFDTELAARLLGMPRVGLGTVVEELLGIHLAKEHSAADWSTRPLPQSWLRYAALDVELLVDLRDAVADLIERSGKGEIVAQEFAAVLNKNEKPPRAEPWRRLSGIHSVRNQRNLAVARELWAARDELASSLDVAPGRLVPDASLTAVAKAMPASRSALSGLREFTGRASRSELDRWWAAVERGLQSEELPAIRTDSDALPPPRAWSDRNPDADVRLKAARSAITAIAEELRMPLENLLTPEHLRRIAWTPPAEVDQQSIAAALLQLGARPWQIDATAQQIASAFVEPHQNESDPSEAHS